jgi:polyphosphate kinase
LAATKQPVATPAAAPPFLNRELSQLDLIRRVLDLAADPTEPLLERVKFCGIVSSILDEFFMVRVAGLQDQIVSGASVRTPDGRTPQQTVAEIRELVLALTAAQTRLWSDGTWQRITPKKSERRRPTQTILMRRRDRARRLARAH